MINKFALSDELATIMEQELKPQEKEISKNLTQAIECLQAAAEIFEEVGFNKRADQILSVLEKFSQLHKHKSVLTNMPSVSSMMEKGITLHDFSKMNAGDLRAKAKINKVLHELGFDPKSIAQVIGSKNYMSKEDSLAFSNPHSSSSNILRMIENPFSNNLDENIEPGQEIAIESIASKHKKPKNPRKISDPHTKGLTSEKMIKNLLHHGTEFNMADDGLADDLLDIDINDADLEVLENELTDMDFEDEI